MTGAAEGSEEAAAHIRGSLTKILQRCAELEMSACASGTLYTVGGGSTRMVVTLIAFIAGSALGAWHFDEWQTLPSLGAFSLLERLGPLGASLATLALAGRAAIARQRL